MATARRAELIQKGSAGEKELIELNEQLARANTEAMSTLSNPNKYKKYVNTTSVPTPLDGKYIKAPTYDQILDVTSDWLNKSSVNIASIPASIFAKSLGIFKASSMASGNLARLLIKPFKSLISSFK